MPVNDETPSNEETPAFDSLEQFNLTPKKHKWIKDDHQPSAIFVVKGGTGKTCFVRMLARHYGWKILTVCDREDLKRYDDRYDAILFGDLIFNHFTQEEILASIRPTGKQS